MDCRIAQQWLLESEAGSVDGAPAEIAEHLAQCEACSTFSARLAHLGRELCALPVPGECEAAKERFLRRIGSNKTAAPLPRPIWARVFLNPRLAIAAAILILIGAGIWLAMIGRRPQAPPPVVVVVDDALTMDDVIAWNLALTSASSLEARNRLYVEGNEALRKRIVEARFDPEDRKLAEELLDNGVWLAKHVDPLDEAERFGQIQTKLLRSIQTAAHRAQTQRVIRLCRQYVAVSDKGIGANVDRAEKSGIKDKNKLAAARRLHRNTIEALEALLPRASGPARGEIKRAIEILKRHPAK